MPLDPGVLSLAGEHRMSGLLWTWAKDREVNDHARAWLALRDLQVQAHLHRVATTLRHVVERLEATDVPFVTIKGITAEQRWYGRRGERPCSDVDLVLHPDHRHRAAEAVLAIQPDHPLGRDVNALVRAGRLQSTTMRHGGIEVDLHFDLFKLGIATRCNERWWDRTEDLVMSDGTRVRVLDDTLALLNLLLHLNKDRFQRLLGFADISRIIATDRVDWDGFLSLARFEGHEVAVASSLRTVLETLELPWPPSLPWPKGPRALAWRVIWRPGIQLRGHEGRRRFRRRQNLIGVLGRGRGHEALGWWWRELWPPPVIVQAHYGDIPGPYVWKLLRGRMGTRRR